MDTQTPLPAKRTVLYFWHHARKYKFLVAGLILLIPLSNLALTILPQLYVSFMLQKLSSGNFIQGQLWQGFGTSLVWYALIALSGGVILWRVTVIFDWLLEMRVVRDINREVFDHLMDLSLSFHSNRFGGSLVSQANKLTSAYIRFADTTIFELMTLFSSFAFAMIILVPRVPWIALFLVAFSIMFILVSIRITRSVRLLRAREADADNKKTGYLADAIANILVVKSFAGGQHERKRYHAATNDCQKATYNVMVNSSKRDTVFSGGTVTLSIGAIVLAVGSSVMFRTPIGTTYLVIAYTGLITQKLWEFAQHILRDYNRAFGDAQEMIEILAIKPDVHDPAKPETSRISNGTINLHNMSFTHPDSREEETLFVDLNLNIAAGEKIGLVGHSGSGKTTLTKLLLRFHDIDDGEILIDGQNIAHLTQDDLRRAIAYVPQEPMLFHRSIAENISYGRTNATAAQIEKAAHDAYADEFIATLPHGYETLVGERGVKLSGGQRQRIAIARAILKDAPILVLDEATSALDSESEVVIQKALWELMRGRTTIVIAHRLSTIQRMDRIVVLDDGKIVEEGSHRELLEQKGTYAKLWKHQSGGFIDE